MTKQSTSLNIDPTLWKDAKIQAIKRGITLTELVENALRKAIQEIQNPKIEHESNNQHLTTISLEKDNISGHSKTKSFSNTSKLSDSEPNIGQTIKVVGPNNITRATDDTIKDTNAQVMKELSSIPTPTMPPINFADTIKELSSMPPINFADTIKELSSMPPINFADTIKELSSMPPINFADTIKELSSMPPINFADTIKDTNAQVMKELSSIPTPTMPPINFADTIKELSSMPPINFADTIKELSSMPPINFADTIKELSSMPPINFADTIKELSSMPPINFADTIKELSSMPPINFADTIKDTNAQVMGTLNTFRKQIASTISGTSNLV